jgi:transketolase
MVLTMIIPLLLDLRLNMPLRPQRTFWEPVLFPCPAALLQVFEGQSDEYKESVLPSLCTNRIVMEVSVTGLWYKYASKVVGDDRFVFSASGGIIMKELGMTAKNNLKEEIASMA